MRIAALLLPVLVLCACQSAGSFPELAKVEREAFGACFYRVIERHCGAPSLHQENCTREHQARYAELHGEARAEYLVSLGCVIPPRAVRVDAGAVPDGGTAMAANAGATTDAGVAALGDGGADAGP